MEETPSQPPGPASAQPVPAGANRTLLLVDDEEQVRLVVQRQLERLGYAVVAANSGQAALACLDAAEIPPRAALLDLTLPEMDGLAVARAILARLPGLPVIIMSGYRSEEVAARLDDLAIAGFLQKPFSLAELREALTAIIGPA